MRFSVSRGFRLLAGRIFRLKVEATELDGITSLPMLEHEDEAAAGVINCAAYSDAHRVADLPLSDVRAASTKGDRFVWIGLFEPHADVHDPDAGPLRLAVRRFQTLGVALTSTRRVRSES
jgi:hypothetical protein